MPQKRHLPPAVPRPSRRFSVVSVNDTSSSGFGIAALHRSETRLSHRCPIRNREPNRRRPGRCRVQRRAPHMGCLAPLYPLSARRLCRPHRDDVGGSLHLAGCRGHTKWQSVAIERGPRPVSHSRRGAGCVHRAHRPTPYVPQGNDETHCSRCRNVSSLRTRRRAGARDRAAAR